MFGLITRKEFNKSILDQIDRYELINNYYGEVQKELCAQQNAIEELVIEVKKLAELLITMEQPEPQKLVQATTWSRKVKTVDGREIEIDRYEVL